MPWRKRFIFCSLWPTSHDADSLLALLHEAGETWAAEEAEAVAAPPQPRTKWQTLVHSLDMAFAPEQNSDNAWQWPVRVDTVDGSSRIGAVHKISAGYKATCRRHRNCTCYLSARAGADLDIIMQDLLQWLGMLALDEQQHYEEALRLRRDEHGMRVRQ